MTDVSGTARALVRVSTVMLPAGEARERYGREHTGELSALTRQPTGPLRHGRAYDLVGAAPGRRPGERHDRHDHETAQAAALPAQPAPPLGSRVFAGRRVVSAVLKVRQGRPRKFQ